MKKIGDYRTFGNYLGKWEIIKILENQNVFLKLRLDKTKCKHCGEFISDERNYTFVNFEVLKEGNRTLILGTTSCGRVVILNDFLSEDEIGEVIKC